MLLESVASGLCKPILSLSCRGYESAVPLGKECSQFHFLGVHCLFFSSSHLIYCIWFSLHIFPFLFVLNTSIFFCACSSNFICPFWRKNTNCKDETQAGDHHCRWFPSKFLGIFKLSISENHCGYQYLKMKHQRILNLWTFSPAPESHTMGVPKNVWDSLELMREYLK